MCDNKTDSYARRFKRVFDYIDRHLDDALLLEKLSEVAHFLPFHFHRQFCSYCGMPPGRYIQVMRLKRASYRPALLSGEKPRAILPLPAARRTVWLRTIRLQRRRMNLRSIFSER